MLTSSLGNPTLSRKAYSYIRFSGKRQGKSGMVQTGHRRGNTVVGRIYNPSGRWRTDCKSVLPRCYSSGAPFEPCL